METYGRYQLLAKLATGGMAQVFLARQSGLEGFEKLVVLKRILPHLAENDEFVRMFLQEARVAARLNHPNVAQIYDLGKEGDTYFIAMEYVHGEDFRRLVRQAGREGRTLPVPLACRMIIGACEGLEFAHQKTDDQGRPLNIVHRDVSPQNLLVTFEGGIKVIDFGIAKAADSASHTRTGVLKGKYSYMSPEQADGQRVDRRSDVFALGIVLYELVTQTRLFKRHTDLATIRAVIDCSVPPPSHFNPAVDPELEAVLLRVLAKDRNKRMPSAGQLQLELEEYLRQRQLPGSTAHLKQFVREVYAERLRTEARLGRPWYEEELPPKKTPSSASFDFERPPEAPEAGQDPTREGRGGKLSDPPAIKLGKAGDVVLVPMPAHPRGAAGPPPLSPTVQQADLSAISRFVHAIRRRRHLGAVLGLVVLLAGVAVAVIGVGDVLRSRADGPRLDLETDPPGAAILVDRRATGKTTPATVALKAGRPHALLLRKSGYADRTDSIPVFTGTLARRYELTSTALGTLRVTTEPPGAAVILDGKSLGLFTPARLSRLDPAVKHQVGLRLQGYENDLVAATVKAGQTSSIDEKLRPLAKAETPPNVSGHGHRDRSRPAMAERATLRVTVTPPVQVAVDGDPRGVSPVTLDLAPGRHELHFTDPATMLDVRESVHLAAGKTKRVDRTFEKRTVRFNVMPYAEVYLGDKHFADSPGDKSLYPGTYRLTYSCPDLKARLTQTLVVPPGQGLIKVNQTLTQGENWK